jgi:ERCC4-type nuclease
VSEPITIVVSKSEPADACERLNSFAGINAVSGEVGTDYVWFPQKMKVGVERKTVSNLLGSLKDRQLSEQVGRGLASFDYYIILIEGEYREATDGFFEYHNPREPRADASGWAKTKWRYDAVTGMLFDFQLLGTRIVQCKMFDYARKIAMLASVTSAENHAFMRERQRPDLPPQVALGGKRYEDAIWALCALDACGPEIAQALLAHFGTLHAVVVAIASKSGVGNVLVKGKKIGTKRGDRMREAVLERFG